MKSRNRLPRLDASFEQQMAAEMATTPAAQQRDVDANFGGDEVKAELMAALEQGHPLTWAVVTYIDEAEKVWRGQKYGFYPPTGLSISFARLYEAEKLEGVGVVTKTDGNIVYGTVSTDAGFKVLADMVNEHRRSGPVSRFDIQKELDVTRQGSALATIEFLRSNNRGVSFADSDALVAEARETAKAILNAKGENYRSVFNKIAEAVAAAHAAVNGRIAGKVTGMANSVNALDDFRSRITAALASTDQNSGRKDLFNMVTELRTIYGAQDPDWKPRDSGQRQGIGNRPDRGGSYGRSNAPGRGKQQHMGRRF